MATLFVRHTVSDFGAWKSFYEGFRPTQKELGVTGEAVYQAADNPNDVTVTHDFASREAAQAFVGNAALKDAMMKAGVTGAPTIWITERA